MARLRLDAELVRRGLAEDRQDALGLVEAHKVQVNGAFADKVERMVDRGDSVEVLAEPPRFVGRGGEKLAGALQAFSFDPAGLRCLDAGASTGGFTDCLLQRGAAEVIAVDVGYGQLHERLVADDRVRNLERTNIRATTTDLIGGSVDLIVGDLSFISLRVVMAPLLALASTGAALVLLVKPQFEAERDEASRGRGIIREPAVWRRVLGEVDDCAAALGAGLQQAAVSPIKGGEGNVEFLFHLVKHAPRRDVDLDALVRLVAPDWRGGADETEPTTAADTDATLGGDASNGS